MPVRPSTYQGYLVDGNGSALATNSPKNFDVVFRIWNDQSASLPANLLWSEDQTITVDKGYFSVLLGEGTPHPNEPNPKLSSIYADSDDSDRFIEITVKGIGAGGVDSTILPRLRLVSAPYAFLARNSVNAANLVNNTNGQVVTVTAGNVGINKTSPNTALDVNGAVTSSGLTINGLASASTLNVSGAANASALNVSGAANVGSLNVSGAATAGRFRATARSLLAGSLCGVERACRTAGHFATAAHITED